MNFGMVAMRDIEFEDRTYLLSEYGEVGALRESLARRGILDPPWVQESGGRYIVVDGFKRLRWAAENGCEGVMCRVFASDLPVRELWTLRIEKRLFEPVINIAEKAAMARALLGVFPPGEVPTFVLDGLQIGRRAGVLERWAWLAEEGTETLRMLASGDIAERAALEIESWDPDSRERMFRILSALRCSASIQVEIVERVDEIAIREGIAPTGVLGCGPVLEILGAGDTNHRQKTQVLRDLLWKMRYPRLSAREERFRKTLDSVGLPGSVRIVPPPAFEGKGWKMEMGFSGPEELRAALETVRGAAASEAFGNLFGTPKTGPGSEKPRR